MEWVAFHFQREEIEDEAQEPNFGRALAAATLKLTKAFKATKTACYRVAVKWNSKYIKIDVLVLN